MTMSRRYELLVRFVVPADDLTQLHANEFEVDADTGTITDPKVMLADFIQATLYDVEGGICMEGEFRVIECRRVEPSEAET